MFEFISKVMSDMKYGYTGDSTASRFNDDNPDITGKGKKVRGIQNGTWTYYYPNGKKFSVGVFNMGRQNGIWKFWYENGFPELVREYQNGKRNGIVRTYYPDGNKCSVGEYNMGIRNGTWKFWYKDGNLETINTYNNGQLNGTRETYFSNGNKRSIGEYNMGIQNGTWKFWYKDGNLKTINKYNNGQLNGTRDTYYNTGWPHRIRTEYKDGIKDGEICGYDSSNRIVYKKWYMNDKLINISKHYKYYDERNEYEIITHEYDKMTSELYNYDTKRLICVCKWGGKSAIPQCDRILYYDESNDNKVELLKLKRTNNRKREYNLRSNKTNTKLSKVMKSTKKNK
jgi:antitoxin component YwqK of YwqJK toxin-antitoxin module